MYRGKGGRVIFMKNILNQKKVKVIVALGCVIIMGALAVVVPKVTAKETKTVVSKESKVERGNLTVGVTESGSITIGAVTQAFELESAASDSTTSTTTEMSNTSGISNSLENVGMDTMNTSTSKSQTAAAGSSESDTIALVVGEVCASVGQVVDKGDALFVLTEDSVAQTRKNLKAAVQSAKLALDKAKIERKTAKLQAEYEYKSNTSLKTTAKSEYNTTLHSLASAVTKAQEAVKEAKTRIKEIPAQIKELEKEQTSLEKESTTTNNQSSNTKASNAMSSLNNSSLTSSSSSEVSSVEKEIEALENERKNYKANYSNLVSQLTQAKSEQVSGKIAAKQKYEEAKVTYENAKELYEIAIDNIDEEVKTAKEAWQEAKETLEAFEKFVGDGTIQAACAGTITSIGYAKEDTLNTETAMATYADATAVNMVVSVSQEDISEVAVGNPVNIVFTAYEEESFAGVVSGIDTSESTSSTVSYDVTVTVSGEVAKLYEGMTGNVTFITKEIKDVLYVSNKAIKTEGTKSYVTKKEGDNLVKTEVTTGFSNGIYVEIQDGLQEGEVVLIESQVSGS